MNNEYYLQDNRSYVGNDILFWADKGGYTTDVSKAEVFTKDKAVRQNQCRETDIPWPKEYIDSITRPAVDMQNAELSIALQDTGIVLNVPKPLPKPVYNCAGCGVFMSELQYYRECKRCGVHNGH